jgi:hypothetical protein
MTLFHGVQGRVLFDLGGFIDCAVDPVLRNDVGPLWLLTLDARGPLSLEAVPLTSTSAVLGWQTVPTRRGRSNDVQTLAVRWEPTSSRQADG